jgi:hypothetical protein
MNEASIQEDTSVESLVAQVADEFLERQKRGERPNVEEYASRHPQAAPLLRKVLASLEIRATLPHSWLRANRKLGFGANVSSHVPLTPLRLNGDTNLLARPSACSSSPASVFWSAGMSWSGSRSSLANSQRSRSPGVG